MTATIKNVKVPTANPTCAVDVRVVKVTTLLASPLADCQAAT